MLHAQQRAEDVRVENSRIALSGLLRYRTGLAFGTGVIDGHTCIRNAAFRRQRQRAFGPMPLPLAFDQPSQPGIMRWTGASRLWFGFWIRCAPPHLPGNYMLCASAARGAGRFCLLPPEGGVPAAQLRYSWTSPRRFATVIASVRLRTFSFVKMLRKCPFTVVSLMKRFAPISLLLLPRASTVNTPSSRPVRVSLLMPAASFSTRACGMQVSPRFTFRIHSNNSSLRASFSR